MRTKIVLSFISIAVVLLISSGISVFEYVRTRNDVTDLISANIECINITQRLSKMCEEHNVGLLNSIGEEGVERRLLPEFDEALFLAKCDSVDAALSTVGSTDLVDSVKCSYYIYMFTSERLKEVVDSNFVDTRDWYFSTLEPVYDRLRTDISDLSEEAYRQLQTNSTTFQEGFYRSIVPGIVAAGVGLVLLLLLMAFISVYYVTPIYKMIENLNASINTSTKYGYKFEGDDELQKLNEEIAEVIRENVNMKRNMRIKNEENENLKNALLDAEE